MNDFFLKNVGLIVTVGFGILLASIGLIMLGSWLKEKYDEFIAKVEYRGAQKFGQRLMQDSYWFSEDKPTMNLLKKIGEDATLGHGFSVDIVRSLWREDRK